MSSRLLLQRATLKPNRLSIPILCLKDVTLDKREDGGLLHATSKQELFSGKFLDKPVCVKRVALVDSALAWNEAEILSQLDNVHQHAYLPRFHGVLHDDHKNLLVVTELLHRLPKGSDEQNAEYVFELAQALLHLHKREICHRDVKLANLLCNTDTNSLKLVDFDRSIEFKHLEGEEYASVGTITHMAPELFCEGASYDHKVDVYAFGITMFELMHPGARPYPKYASPALPGYLSKQELAQLVCEKELRPQWTNGNQALRELAEKCWAQAPSQRPDFEEIVTTLEHILARKRVLGENLKREPQLQAPTTAAVSVLQVGSYCSRGHVRTTMEDASCLLVAPTFTMLGAFDGLRAHHTSSFAARMFPLLYVDSLKRTFAETDALLEEMDFECGSTATVVVVTQKQIKAGWLGDSSAYLFTKTKALPSARYRVKDLIIRHNPDRLDEKMRIEDVGGEVRRDTNYLDNGELMPVGPWRALLTPTSKVGIAISRAFGLFKFRPVLSNQPEFITVDRQPEDRFLVVATDGLWDLVDLNQVLKVLRESEGNAELAAKRLVELALDKGAHDNVSVVVAMM